MLRVCSIEELLNMELEGLNFEIREILHRIKYNQEDYIEWLFNVDLSNIEKLNKKQFKNLCILATFIQVAFALRGDAPPKWVGDKRLFMERAFVSDNCSEFDIFEAYQAEFDHNVFYPKASFEII